MQVFEKKSALNHCLSLVKEQNKSIGFVPTMGALHKGHLSLIENSQKDNDITVVSIFVNPTQFDKKEDLEKYPKTVSNDLNLLEKIKCDIVFIPSVEEIYTSSITSKSYNFDGLENQMEGKFRKGHFDGVATIVQKLFEIVQPTSAYFGEKDFQQLQIVKKLVQKNKLPVNVVGCPIYREKGGLAMSSRNNRLTELQKEQALFIYQKLQEAKKQVKVMSVSELILYVTNQFNNNSVLQLEYFTIAEETTLQSPQKINSSKKYRAFIAVHIEGVRLIDNIAL